MSEQRTRRRLLQQTALAAGAAAFLQNKVAAQTPSAGLSGGGPSPCMKFFSAGFRNERIKTTGAEINTVIGGSGPPLLLLHGAPESVIAWRVISDDLAKDYTVVMCDLRGYGDSSKPPDAPDHSSQSKRPMALDGVEVMEHLGFRQFRLVGHDRGGRVGRRMALDHPDRVQKLAVLDIVPAHYLYSHVTIEFVQAYFHWFNYLRAAPGPENELKAANDAAAARGGNDVAKEYSRNNTDIRTIHAMCEDYRASASIDLKIDDTDIKAGKKIQCPLLTLWAASGPMGRIFDGKSKPSVLEIWKEEGVNVSGKGLPPPAGHNLQESSPKDTLEELQKFLRG